MEQKAILTKEENEAALRLVEFLMDGDSAADSPRGKLLVHLADEIQKYEKKFDLPSHLWKTEQCV